MRTYKEGPNVEDYPHALRPELGEQEPEVPQCAKDFRHSSVLAIWAQGEGCKALGTIGAVRCAGFYIAANWGFGVKSRARASNLGAMASVFLVSGAEYLQDANNTLNPKPSSTPKRCQHLAEGLCRPTHHGDHARQIESCH